MTGYHFILSHTVAILFKLDQFVLTNGLQIPCGRGGVLMLGLIHCTWTVTALCDWVNLEIHSTANIEWAWRPWLNQCWVALGRCNRVSWEIHFMPVMKRAVGCNWRLWSCEHGSHNGADLDIYLEAVIKQVSRRIKRTLSREFGAELWCGQSADGSLGETHNSSWNSTQWITVNCENVENWVPYALSRYDRQAGSGRQLIFGWCSMLCMPELSQCSACC